MSAFRRSAENVVVVLFNGRSVRHPYFKNGFCFRYDIAQVERTAVEENNDNVFIDLETRSSSLLDFRDADVRVTGCLAGLQTVSPIPQERQHRPPLLRLPPPRNMVSSSSECMGLLHRFMTTPDGCQAEHQEPAWKLMFVVSACAFTASSRFVHILCISDKGPGAHQVSTVACGPIRRFFLLAKRQDFSSFSVQTIFLQLLLPDRGALCRELPLFLSSRLRLYTDFQTVPACFRFQNTHAGLIDQQILKSYPLLQDGTGFRSKYSVIISMSTPASAERTAASSRSAQ